MNIFKWHSSCKFKQQEREKIPLRLFYEPTNVADENAVLAQVQWHYQEWIFIDQHPKEESENIFDELLDDIKIVKSRKSTIRTLSISQFKYTPTLVTKQGCWSRDNDSYSYMDCHLLLTACSTHFLLKGCAESFELKNYIHIRCCLQFN